MLHDFYGWSLAEKRIAGALFQRTSCNTHEISRKSLFLISGSGRSTCLCFIMYANDQELSAFKVLLINVNLEEAKRIFTRKLDVLRNEIRTASDLILQNLPCDDFATCLIPADVNQVKGECFSAIKATANRDCLFNSSSRIILLHRNESLAILRLLHLMRSFIVTMMLLTVWNEDKHGAARALSRSCRISWLWQVQNLRNIQVLSCCK